MRWSPTTCPVPSPPSGVLALRRRLGEPPSVSDASQGPGWWMASDGKWYPPQPAAAPPPPPPPPPIPPPTGWQVTGVEAQVGATSYGVGAPGPWTPPPGYVPPPPPPGYVPPAGITEIIETPVSPFRKTFFTI